MNLKDFAADLSQLLYYLKNADIPEKYWPAAIQACATETAGERIGLQIRNALNDHAAYVSECLNNQLGTALSDLPANVGAIADAIANFGRNDDDDDSKAAPSAGVDLAVIIG